MSALSVSLWGWIGIGVGVVVLILVVLFLVVLRVLRSKEFGDSMGRAGGKAIGMMLRPSFWKQMREDRKKGSQA